MSRPCWLRAPSSIHLPLTHLTLLRAKGWAGWWGSELRMMTVGSDEWPGSPSEGQGSGCGLQDPEAPVRSGGLLPPLYSSVRPCPKPSISRQESHQKHAL